MTRAVIADTGPLYASVDPSDAHHRRAHREADALADDELGVVVAYPTLYETYSLVLHRLGPALARRLAAEVLSSAVVVSPEVEDHRAAVDLVGQLPDQRITLFDAIVAVLARRLRVAAWTYDADFDVMRCPVWRP